MQTPVRNYVLFRDLSTYSAQLSMATKTISNPKTIEELRFAARSLVACLAAHGDSVNKNRSVDHGRTSKHGCCVAFNLVYH